MTNWYGVIKVPQIFHSPDRVTKFNNKLSKDSFQIQMIFTHNYENVIDSLLFCNS